jgi:hypothetical protein
VASRAGTKPLQIQLGLRVAFVSLAMRELTP